jgi:tetratricopeptide (TPR) repeat protein
MLAKESAIVLPALLVAVDLAHERARGSRTPLIAHARAILPPIVLLAPVALAFLGLRVYVLGSVTGEHAAPWLPFLREDGRIFVAFRAWLEYVRLLFWPMDLSADYSPGVILPVTSFTPAVLAGAGFLAATVIFTLALPRRPDVGLPAAWFLFAILPVSNLLVPVGIVVAERTLYLPSLAVSIAAAYAWTGLERNEHRRHARKLAVAAAAVILVLFGGRSVLRNPEWESTDTILAALLRDHPESYRAQWYAGHRASQRGDLEAAAEHWALACRLWPRDAVLLTECGVHYLRAAQPHMAVAYLEASRAMTPGVARTEGLLAEAYLLTNRPHDALRAAELASRLGPPDPAMPEVRARALMMLGEYEQAAAEARTAIGRAPEARWTTWAFYARLLAMAGSPDAAAAALDTATLRAGDDARALEALQQLRDSLFVLGGERKGRDPALRGQDAPLPAPR